MPPKSFVTPRANIRSRGYLPHWELPDATYHIIFRLDDSLPRHVAEQLALERKALGRIDFEKRFDEALDRGFGSGALKEPRVAEIVVKALQHFHGARYELFTWCVMPNHVHVIAQLRDSLDRVVHSWKSYTAHRANEILNLTGRFWSREYFDRIVRDHYDLHRLVTYVLSNPDCAGLADWPWRGSEI